MENQTVPTLKDFLDLAAEHGRLVIFDLRRPPQGHPYHDTWITRTLEVIHNESSINSSQVLQSTDLTGCVCLFLFNPVESVILSGNLAVTTLACLNLPLEGLPPVHAYSKRYSCNTVVPITGYTMQG